MMSLTNHRSLALSRPMPRSTITARLDIVTYDPLCICDEAGVGSDDPQHPTLMVSVRALFSR
jgi:hypothetical protein